MKIKQEHIDIIKPFIQFTLELKRNVIITHVKILRLDDRIKDLDKRLAYDIFSTVPSEFKTEFYDKVYKYANDTHVYTVLKSIINPSNFTRITE